MSYLIVLLILVGVSVIYIKSYDFTFNDFAEKIDKRNNKSIIKLPHYVLKLLKFISKSFYLKTIYLNLSKISNHLTFDNALLLKKIKQND